MDIGFKLQVYDSHFYSQLNIGTYIGKLHASRMKLAYLTVTKSSYDFYIKQILKILAWHLYVLYIYYEIFFICEVISVSGLDLLIFLYHLLIKITS